MALSLSGLASVMSATPSSVAQRIVE